MIQHDDSLDRRIEEAASKLPPHEPSPSLWPIIHGRLRAERDRVDSQASILPFPGFFQRWFGKRAPMLAYVTYAVILTVGIATSIYLINDRSQPVSEIVSFDGPVEPGYIEEVQADIEQAMFYYERAIEKMSLQLLSESNTIDPELAALRTERIAYLRNSIADCKQALKNNRSNPVVQHYLLTAYADLQNVLQEMISETDTQIQ